MPNPLEFPGMLRAVVKLVGGKRRASLCRSVVQEFVTLALGLPSGSGRLSRRRPRLKPGFPAVIRALNDLSKPATGLRNVKAIRIGGRTLGVINLPAREMRATDVPLSALAIRGQDKRSLSCSNQHSNRAHRNFLPGGRSRW